MSFRKVNKRVGSFGANNIVFLKLTEKTIKRILVRPLTNVFVNEQFKFFYKRDC